MAPKAKEESKDPVEKSAQTPSGVRELLQTAKLTEEPSQSQQKPKGDPVQDNKEADGIEPFSLG